MAAAKVNVEKLVASARDFDYLRFTWACLHGIPVGKTVAVDNVSDAMLENGITAYTGILAMGPGNELVNLPEVEESGYPNLYGRPASDLVVELPWATEGKFRVGEVICETVLADGSPQEQCPRFVARKQLDKLAELGFKLYSTSEIEFMITEIENLKPLFDGNDYMKSFTLSKHETMFFEMEQMLRKAGIQIETFQTEYSPGQFEFTFKPKYGIDAADDIVRFKEAMKEMCHQRGCQMTCMTTPFSTTGFSNGAHYNFSLWTVDGNKNAFYDPKKADNLSDTARHFIGGYLKHINAITALFCPTVNCYRRLHKGLSPDTADWGIENRFTSLRVKNANEQETYMENRIATGSCNPYLVLAATVAAGIDGIMQKIEPPVGGRNKGAGSLPHCLQDALTALQHDTYMVQALGEGFVRWFVQSKEQIDLTKFKDHDVKQSVASEMDAERHEFFTFM